MQALAARLHDAERRCADRECDEVLGRFRRVVAHSSKAVLCRSLVQALTLLSSDDQFYALFLRASRCAHAAARRKLR